MIVSRSKMFSTTLLDQAKMAAGDQLLAEAAQMIVEICLDRELNGAPRGIFRLTVEFEVNDEEENG